VANVVKKHSISSELAPNTKTEAGRELTLSVRALTRLGQPSDVADVVVFLASDKAVDHGRQYSG
jgi:NAD(P)-dependent dehydrogenase (short-subunit alcohol dehydrogenase family)